MNLSFLGGQRILKAQKPETKQKKGFAVGVFRDII